MTAGHSQCGALESVTAIPGHDCAPSLSHVPLIEKEFPMTARTLALDAPGMAVIVLPTPGNPRHCWLRPPDGQHRLPFAEVAIAVVRAALASRT